MNKKVIISVVGNQSLGTSEVNKLELVTEGRYYKKGSTYYITYKESEVTGLEGTTTTVKLANGVVTLMRFGNVTSQLTFEAGQKHISYYETNYGTFTIGVLANEVNIKVDDNGGQVKVDYLLELDNNSSGENDFYMSIREAGQSNDEYSGQNKATN